MELTFFIQEFFLKSSQKTTPILSGEKTTTMFKYSDFSEISYCVWVAICLAASEEEAFDKVR